MQNKLSQFQDYYNKERGHGGINGAPPQKKSGEVSDNIISLDNFQWKKHCRGLFQLPAAA